jgi:hypothetical protein
MLEPPSARRSVSSRPASMLRRLLISYATSTCILSLAAQLRLAADATKPFARIYHQAQGRKR